MRYLRMLLSASSIPHPAEAGKLEADTLGRLCWRPEAGGAVLPAWRELALRCWPRRQASNRRPAGGVSQQIEGVRG